MSRLRPGDVFAGYTIVRELGAGGMGEVYLAAHPRLPRHDAVKVLAAPLASDGQFRARFEREADVVAGLRHRGIVRVYDRGESGGRLWIAFEYVEGTDLADYAQTHHPIPTAQVGSFISEIATALDHAAARGLVHRDVKPANILIDETGNAVLTDFGIAHNSSDDAKLTGTGLAIGTVQYSSPEQLLGRPIDSRTDQYSLACTAYKLLTGVPPFTGPTPSAIVVAHVQEPPPDASGRRTGLTPAVDAVLHRALAKNPVNRYRSNVEFASSLNNALAVVAEDPSPPIPPSPMPDPQWPQFASRPISPPPPAQAMPSAIHLPSAHAAPRARRRRRLLLIGWAIAAAMMVALAAVFVVLPRPSAHVEAPRVVALGGSDGAIALELGVKPVAIYDRSRFGEATKGVGVWDVGKFGDDTPVLMSPGSANEYDYGQIAELKPTLILNVDAYNDPGVTSRLSQIAPVVSKPAGTALSIDWRTQTKLIGEALGKSAAADRLIADHDATITRLRNANPDFSGTTLTYASKVSDGYRGYVSGPYEVFAGLGFKLNAVLMREQTGGIVRALVGPQDVSNLDAQVALFTNDSVPFAAVQKDTGLHSLPVVLGGRAVFVRDDDPIIQALLASTPASRQYAAEKITPRLASAVAKLK